MCVCVCVCACVCVCVCVCVCEARVREGERVYIYIYICACVYAYFIVYLMRDWSKAEGRREIIKGSSCIQVFLFSMILWQTLSLLEPIIVP